MLDVLIPVADALEAGASEPADVTRAANAAADATIPIRAVRGRASFLGDRSIGHMDPGARSSALIIEAIGSVLEKA
jgi:dihydroxyacetone kinase-like protein